MWTGSPAEERDDAVVLLILALFAGVVTLGAAAITTGLSKADAEADLTTLSAVGAPRPYGARSPASSAWSSP